MAKKLHRAGFILGVALILSGCTSAPGHHDHGTTSNPTSSSSLGSFDELSADEKAEVEAQLSQAAENSLLTDPPETEIVRLVSLADWPQTMVSCMTDAGFTVTVTPNGNGWTGEYGPDQEEAYNLASYICSAQFPIHPSQTGELSAEQKQKVYAYVSDTLVPCLKAEGYQTPGLPTEATFLAGFDDAPPWNPYTQIYATVTSSSELDRLEGLCPPNTPPQLLYGE
jgi:hypothetical protein